jgi:hypothetical protein
MIQTARPSITITLPALDPVQQAVWDAPEKRKVLPWARRRGKSKLKMLKGIDEAFRGHIVWWIWPNRPQSYAGWRGLREVATQIKRQLPALEIREVDRMIRTPMGGELQIKSADRPESLVGDALHVALFDETGIIQERTWTESVEPMLLDFNGEAWFGGTPKGKNWFNRLNLWGLSDSMPGWVTIHQTMFDSPYITDAQKEEKRAQFERGEIPERMWRQEYLAEFVDDHGAVFRKVTEAATAIALDEKPEGHDVVIGIDWGKLNDFTVFSAGDIETSEQIALERFNKIDYQFQLARLQEMCEKYDPIEVIAERNAMGEPLIEQAERMGIPIRGFTTTGVSKKPLIEALAIGLESGKLKILPDPILIAELQAYEMKVTPAGNTTFSAPDGLHDDTVIGTALMWSGMYEGADAGVVRF